MVANRAQIFIIDAVIASLLIVITVLDLFLIQQLNITKINKAPDDVLGVLCMDEDFLQAVYSLDLSRVEAILNSYLGMIPYNLTVYDANGNILLTVGQNVEGISAVIMIPGINGTLKPIIISLKVGAPP